MKTKKEIEKEYQGKIVYFAPNKFISGRHVSQTDFCNNIFVDNNCQVEYPKQESDEEEISLGNNKMSHYFINIE